MHVLIQNEVKPTQLKYMYKTVKLVYNDYLVDFRLKPLITTIIIGRNSLPLGFICR